MLFILPVLTQSLTSCLLHIVPGGNQRGVFDLGLVQDEWKMYVKQPLDREQSDSYVINVTASDGLFVCETTVAVTVTDANDNQPLFLQVRIETEQSG